MYQFINAYQSQVEFHCFALHNIAFRECPTDLLGLQYYSRIAMHCERTSVNK